MTCLNKLIIIVNDNIDNNMKILILIILIYY